MGQIFLRLRALYRKEGGAFPDPILNLTWNYSDESEPKPAELAREYSGRALTTLNDPTDPNKVIVEAGKQLLNFSQLRDDGSTACGCWIYSGAFNEAGNNMARRDNTDKEGHGTYAGWTWSLLLNRRIINTVDD